MACHSLSPTNEWLGFVYGCHFWYNSTTGERLAKRQLDTKVSSFPNGVKEEGHIDSREAGCFAHLPLSHLSTTQNQKGKS